LTNGKPEKTTAAVAPVNATEESARALRDAKQIVIIPGYGMALAKAQFKVAELATLLKRNGTSVKFAIHPVAGRMPGHMNVILAEAEVDYDDLFEMDEVNPLFKETDVALVVGACDVVNPAANEATDTPISGMPILLADEAKTVVVCNLDATPGYSGVENPLYDMPKTITLFGDAKVTVTQLMEAV
jgi:NAD(P) transhydrogenase subunit beta